MNNIEYVLDFATKIARELILSGANLERVRMTIMTICNAYELDNISLHSLSTFISVSATDSKTGEYSQRQISIQSSFSLNLDRLKALNNLSYEIVRDIPNAALLDEKLESINHNTYPWWVTFLGYILAMSCLSRIFGATYRELIVAIFNTVLLYFLSKLFSKIKLNHIIRNFVATFITGSLTILFFKIELITNFYVTIITSALYLLPGVAMVNSARNILCGNEMNGIIELLKVILEVIVIVAGIASAFFLFGSSLPNLEDSIVVREGLLHDIELIGLSLLASFGFSIVFNINPKDLAFGAMGGLIIRITIILLSHLTSYRILYTVIAAFFAALYSEILANIKKEPSTLYLYPSIIPIIPGDLLYYSMLGVVWANGTLFMENALQCLLVLAGISFGFVLCSSFMHYVRRIKFRKLLESIKIQPKTKLKEEEVKENEKVNS